MLVGLVLLVGSTHSFSTVGVRRSLVGKWGSESSVELGKQQHLDSSCLRRELVMSTLADVQPNVNLKVAVAGGGVGGVFAAYALQKKGFDVTIFEKASKFSRFGGPIQLASNALSCVNALSPEIFEEIMGRFTFTGTRKCGIKDGIRNEWYSVFEAITNLAEWNDLPYTGVIDRPDLQEILLANMQPDTVKNNMGVSEYTQNDDGTVDIIVNKGTDTEEEIKGFDY